MKKIWSTEEIRQIAMGRRGFLRGATALAGGIVAGPMFPHVAGAEIGGSFELMAWEGFELTDELQDWYAEHGVTPQFTAMGSQDDVTIRFSAPNPPPFDAAEYNHGYADLYIDILDICRPLDKARIPNYNADNLWDAFYDKPTWYRNDTLYGVPYAWGLNAIVYNPAMMAKPESYTDLLKPELKGKIAFVDDTLATWPLMATVAGFGDKFPNVTPAEMEAIFEHCKAYRDQARIVSPTYGDIVSLFVSGEIAAMFSGWTGVPVETAKSGVTTEYAIAREGAGTWSDAWFMPKSVDNEDTAYAFFDKALDPQIQAQIAMRNQCGVVSPKAVEHLSEEARAMFDYDDIAATFAAAPLLGIPPIESDEYATYDQWVTAWSAFKAF